MRRRVRHLTYTRAVTPLIERFLRRATITPEGCWVWNGSTVKGGYGRTTIGSRTDGTRRKVLVYVAAWESVNGPVPDGLTLDHEGCDNPPCFNPAHLVPKTQRDNTMRSATSPTAVNTRKECCPKCGGEYSATATGRVCRPCRLAYWRGYNTARGSARASART